MSQLSELLARETSLVDRFVTILKSEGLALKSHQVEHLDAIIQDKLAVIEQLNAVGAERSALLAPTGESLNQAVMDAWFAGNPKELAAKKAWGTLLERAKEARDLHLANSQLVNVFLKNTNEALDILLQLPKEQALYGSDGQASAKTGSRIVDSA